MFNPGRNEETTVTLDQLNAVYKDYKDEHQRSLSHVEVVVSGATYKGIQHFA